MTYFTEFLDSNVVINAHEFNHQSLIVFGYIRTKYFLKMSLEVKNLYLS
jgi:hypothetical protein